MQLERHVASTGVMEPEKWQERFKLKAMAREIQSEGNGMHMNFGTALEIYRKRYELLTSMEYALPRRKLTSKAHINGADLDLIPMPMLYKVGEKEQC